MSIYQITASHFCAGFESHLEGVFGAEKVVEAAPIIGYMGGWTVQKVESYCEKKGWKLRRIT